MLTWNKIIYYTQKGNPKPIKRVEKTQAQWEALLSPEEFKITRLKGTERPFSGEHCSSFSEGTYTCTCCNTPLFKSEQKFETNSGWPGFSQPLEQNAIKYHKDNSHGMIRIEILCNICDAHLGHVFPDGPLPSKLRYCINSLSIKLINNTANNT
ncbi:MAG: peptide-methionine (R)-S-oxide reductase MsrB [Tenacibaculum sp.]